MRVPKVYSVGALSSVHYSIGVHYLERPLRASLLYLNVVSQQGI